MVLTSGMKTSRLNTMDPDGCAWLMQGQTQMGHNSTSPWLHVLGWMALIPALARFWREWYVPVYIHGIVWQLRVIPLQDVVYRATNDIPTNSNDRPLKTIKIVDSGTLPLLEGPFVVEKAGVL